MRGFDFTSWQGIVSTLVGIALFTLIGVGIRLMIMLTIQQRRERMNRQINERLRTLIAAYKTLGGSFTGDLTVDPTHLRDVRRRARPAADPADPALDLSPESVATSDRTRRIRDAVEAALSDIILLGTEEQVRLAERAARELVEGRPVHTQDLVVSLRSFVRQALDLDPVPDDLAIPMQGPVRPSGGSGRDKGSGKQEGSGGGRGAAGGMSAGGGMGLAGGMGLGLAAGGAEDAKPSENR